LAVKKPITLKAGSGRAADGREQAAQSATIASIPNTRAPMNVRTSMSLRARMNRTVPSRNERIVARMNIASRRFAALTLGACTIALTTFACSPAGSEHRDSISGRDDRPVVMDSLAALAPIGITIPPFSYPSIRGWKFDRARLAYGHTVIALVDSSAKGSDPAIQEFDSLKHRYPGIRFAIIFNRGVQPRDSTADTAQWTHLGEVGFAGSRIADAWAPGIRDTSDPRRRIELRLPSFLVVSDSGRVLARAVGRPLVALIPVLDSLRRYRDSTEAVEGAATLARGRPLIERAFRAFDPATLTFRDSIEVRLDGTCGGEETVGQGIIPAAIRPVEMRGSRDEVHALVDVVSIATVEPVDADDICQARELRVTPRIATTRYQTRLIWCNPDRDDRSDHGAWSTIQSMARPDDSSSYGGIALVGVAGTGTRYILPAGITPEVLRAQIDSIRAAQK
jgi:hypothetical protein